MYGQWCGIDEAAEIDCLDARGAGDGIECDRWHGGCGRPYGYRSRGVE